MDLIPCPVCTLYLRKGMSLAEHLETHPKEQVIKALVTLATLSSGSFNILPENEISLKLDPAKSENATSDFSSSLVVPTAIHSSATICAGNLQSGIILESNSQDFVAINSTSQNSSSKNISSPNACGISNTEQRVFTQLQQQATHLLNRETTLIFPLADQQIATKPPPPPLPPILVSPINNSATHLQQIFNYKAKQLPPPPAYGQAISQLRSQNNQNKFNNKNNIINNNNINNNSINTNINNSTNNSTNNNNNNNNINSNINKKVNNISNNNNQISVRANSNISTQILSNNIHNQQNLLYTPCNNNYMTNNNQGTLDYSLPKQSGNSIKNSNASNSRKSQNQIQQQQQQLLESQRTQSFLVNDRNNSTMLFAPSVSSGLVQVSHQQKNTETSRSIKNQLSISSAPPSYTPPLVTDIPNPVCLVSAARNFGSNTSLPSPFLRSSNSPGSSVLRFAIETPITTTITNESSVSARYIERENGDFKVEESPRHVVECVEKDNGEFSFIEKIIHSPPSVVQMKISDDEYSEGEDMQKINNNDNQIQQINNLGFVSSNANLSGNSKNSSISPTKSFKNSVTILSNIKLDPNESLDLMESIKKDGAEYFWSGIVNSIKKEEPVDKRFNITIIDEHQVTETDNIINNCLENMPTISSAATTSVIRLASGSCSKTSLDNISHDQEKNITSKSGIISNKKNLPMTKPSNQIKNSSNAGKILKPFKKQPKKLVVKLKNHPLPPDQNIEVINLEDQEPVAGSSSKMLKEQELEKAFINVNQNLECNDIDFKETIEMKTDVKENPFPIEEMNFEIDSKVDQEEIKKEIQITSVENLFSSDVNKLTDNNTDTNDKIMETEISKNNERENDSNSKTTQPIIQTTIQPTIQSSNINTFSFKKSKTEYVLAKNAYEKSDTIFSIHSIDEDDIEPSTSAILTTTKSLSSFPISNIKQAQNSLLKQEPDPSTSANANTASDLNASQHYTDYPFSFLYGGGIDKITSTTITADSLVYSNNENIEIFNRYQARDDDDNEEKSSYLDLDSCKQTNSCSSSIPQAGCSNSDSNCSAAAIRGILSIASNHMRDAALNIRTDEKMPAKGEISEQESNGDIENSWSQPIYNEVTYRFPNPYDNFVNREDWSLSHDDFFVPHDLTTNNSCRPKIVSVWSTDNNAEVNHAPTANFEIKKKSSKKTSTITLAQTSGAGSSVGASSNPELLSTNIAQPITATKRKSFQCDHCGVVFPKLKERNHHLINSHQYKRIKGSRRLVRDPPSATITSAQVELLPISDIQLPKSEPGIEVGVISTQGTDIAEIQEILVKTEETVPEVTTARNQVSSNDGVDEKKPVVGVVSTTTELPRTKYDSIRANVYRMLMTFNLTVLQQKSETEIDKSLFDSKSFCCYTCKRDFISVKLFDEHLSEHPAECFTCSKKFSRWTYFSVHLKRHLGWKDFGCTVCDKKFVVRSALVEHVRTHTGATPLKCNMCEKAFKRYSNLTQHKKVCHSNKPIRKKEYVCYCGEVSPSKARFLWHKEIHDSKPKCCPWCRDRFVHANSLRRHIRLAHSEKFAYAEPVECPICQQVYAKSSLKGHMATHSMDTQHECAICNKSFSTKWNLKIHSWVHANRTAKPFKCEHCTKAFVREIDYKNHMNSHRQIRPYTCEYCGCKFIRKYNYMRHRREHHGQKKFSCDLCGKLFHRHYYLIEHRRIHTGERPFLCTICGKSSTTKTNHNKHLKIHHSRDPFTSEA